MLRAAHGGLSVRTKSLILLKDTMKLGGKKEKKKWKESRGAFMEAAKAPRAEKSHGGVNATHETSAF